MHDGPKDGFAFIIDTDSYAGNFEREMCAHITGCVGDCGVGEEFAEAEISKLFPNVQNVPDDNGCYRPTSCWPVAIKEGQRHPDCNAVAIFFDTKPTDEQIKLMKERSLTFNDADSKENQWHKDIKILEYHLLEFNHNVSEITI